MTIIDDILVMSVNSLLSPDGEKSWANLYVNTLTAYNGIFGDFKGNSEVTGTTTFKDDVAFEEDVLMDESLKMTTGDIVSADGQNTPWFVRQQDVQNGDGGQAPTGLSVVEPAQTGYKQLRTYESADGGYVHYGGEDNRILTYHTASDIIDEGVEEEGLIAKSAGGIAARGLEAQDFHTSNLLQEPGVLKSVYNPSEDRHELSVQKVSLDEIDTPAGVSDGDIIRYNSGTGQLQFETFPAGGGGGGNTYPLGQAVSSNDSDNYTTMSDQPEGDFIIWKPFNYPNADGLPMSPFRKLQPYARGLDIGNEA